MCYDKNFLRPLLFIPILDSSRAARCVRHRLSRCAEPTRARGPNRDPTRRLLIARTMVTRGRPCEKYLTIHAFAGGLWSDRRQRTRLYAGGLRSHRLPIQPSCCCCCKHCLLRLIEIIGCRSGIYNLLRTYALLLSTTSRLCDRFISYTNKYSLMFVNTDVILIKV